MSIKENIGNGIKTTFVEFVLFVIGSMTVGEFVVYCWNIHRFDFIVFTSLCLFFGFALGVYMAICHYQKEIEDLKSLIASKDAQIAEKDERIAELENELAEIKRKAQAASKPLSKFERFKDPVTESDVARVREMDHDEKAMILAAATKGFAFCRTDQTYKFFISGVSRFVDTETLRNGVSRLRPTSKLKKIVEERRDAFDAVSDGDMAERDCLRNPDAARTPRGKAIERMWWWTDDADCAKQFM